MRPVVLGQLKKGINRLSIKGPTSPRELYDLLNGYIDVTGSVQVREGTTRSQALTAATIGLSASNGVYNVFATAIQAVPSGYLCNLLIHPTDSTQTLKKIWFAKPFMGFPYVVAEFNNNDVYHYWLQSDGARITSHVYFEGNIIFNAATGLAYQSQRNLAPNPRWAPQTTVALNSLIEPTEYTGFYYKALTVVGTSPHTGPTEPVWPIVENGTVQEFGDFDATSSAAPTGTSSSGQPLGSVITDRYGHSQTIAGNQGTAGSSSVVPVAAATVTTWAPGTLYSPGSVVRPSTGQGAFINAIPNGDFENGDDGNWVNTAGVTYNSLQQYQGNFCLQMIANNNTVTGTMLNYGTVTPGQSVTAHAYLNPVNTTSDLTMTVRLRWYTAADVFISSTESVWQQNFGYRKTSVTGIAPATAARCRVQIAAFNGTSAKTGYADLVDWSLETPAAVSTFLYEAVQSVAASSSNAEPVWPTVPNNTVVDGGVTWKAIGTSIVTWQAIPIMKSGSGAITYPTIVGTSVSDNTMSWVAINRNVPAPQSKSVALAASHVFAGDNDIVPFSAAVDPTDWTSTNNAGYLPTGLNNYGDNPIAMLALYRSNLMAFNASGYQMWQVDPDPANMALLDAQPVGSIYPQAAQSVANDLLFLTEVGVRNIGTVGATANMQIGNLGQPVDPIVAAALKAGTYAPLSLYYPGRGQYWLVFGPQAFVLTVNGAGLKTWSRYVFPSAITDWTLNAGNLYLRTASNLVWVLDSAATVDDFGGANVNFSGVVQWPYINTGRPGMNDELVGVDIVGIGACTIQIGFDQNDLTTFSDNAGFATSLGVTPPYALSAADSVPGTPIPIPATAPSFTFIATFGPNQNWSLDSANLYVIDARGGGQTG